MYKIWESGQEHETTASEAESVDAEIRKWRGSSDFKNKKMMLANGEEIMLSKVSIVGYRCGICGERHMYMQHCPKEHVGPCPCGKTVARYVRDRNAHHGQVELRCMLHSGLPKKDGQLQKTKYD